MKILTKHIIRHRSRPQKQDDFGGTAALFFACAALALIGMFAPHVRAAEDVLVMRVGKVVTMDAKETVVNNAVVVVRGGKFESVKKGSEMPAGQEPAGARVIEMPECWLVPGFVDCHNHTGGSLRDLNDMVYLTNPGLRTLDTVVPESDDVKRGRMGGVTTALLIPGSGTNLSGFGTIVKFAGDTVDEMVLKAPGSIKIAQAGNPERYWYGVGRTMMNYNTRQTLTKAQRYHEAWTAFEKGTAKEKPAFDPVFDDFRGLFRHEYVASMHTQIYQVVMTSIDMMARKFKVRTVLDHSTFDAWKNAPVILETGEDMIQTICGPRTFYLDPTQRRMNGIAARWSQAGLKQVGINTDAPVIPQEELPFQAAMNCWFGFKPYLALKALTSVPAGALMVDDRVGSIEAGKDADFGVWTGDPLDPRSRCKITVINGKIVNDGRGGQRW